MNTRLLTATVAVAAALSAGQAFAFDEANQFNPNAVTTGAVTRTQVKAELGDAARAGQLARAVDTGSYQSDVATATQATGKSRAEVKAEAVQAARAHQLPLADQAF